MRNLSTRVHYMFTHCVYHVVELRKDPLLGGFRFHWLACFPNEDAAKVYIEENKNKPENFKGWVPVPYLR